MSKLQKEIQLIDKKDVGDSILVRNVETKKTENLSELNEMISTNLESNTQALLLGDGRTEFFVTEDSRKYISQAQQYKKDHSYDYIDPRGCFDSVHVRYVRRYTASELQQNRIVAEFRNAKDITESFRKALEFDMSPIRMWKVSLAGAVLFGMISMNMIYKNLGQSAMAKESAMIPASEDKSVTFMIEDNSSAPAVAKLEQYEEENERMKVVDGIIKERRSLEESMREMVKGHPIEDMLPYILEQDPEVAKYLIAIAKQESQWGKRVPVLNGQDCYNYWGFRSKRKLMGSGGHTCFNSRKDAVETVGKRIHELIYKYDRRSAKRLIVWKCGSSCEGHSQAGVDRWIGTVGSYYNKLSK